MSDTVLDERTVTYNGNGDHDIFSHYANKIDIVRSVIEGTPLMALCGKIWIPSRDPERYPICPTCKEIYEGLF